MSPRTLKQFDKIGIERRAIIEKAALKLISEKGLAHTSIASIAKEAHISKGLIDNYFICKFNLLRVIVFPPIKEMLALFDFLKFQNYSEAIFYSMIKYCFGWLVHALEYPRFYFGILLRPSVILVMEKELLRLTEEFFENRILFLESMGLKMRYINSVLDGRFLYYIMDSDNYRFGAIKKK